VTVLGLDRVSFWYPASDRPALRDVSLRVGRGEIVALVGSVGAGCSTLLGVAAGLAPRVTGGRLEGTVAFAASGAAGGGRVLLLPAPWTQLSGMGSTVRDEVAFGPANLGWPVARIRAAAQRAMAAAAVTHLADRDPLTLSGGELQRVAIARALVGDPKLVLADEPTGNLDPENARHVLDLLRAQVKERGASAILVTHSEAAAAGCDRRYRLSLDGLKRLD